VPPVAPATLRGVVRNPDLTPADGARVRVLAAGDAEVASTLSEPDGTYVVTVAPGSYRVLATKGPSAVDVPSVFLDEGATVVQDLVMASAAGLGVVQGTMVWPSSPGRCSCSAPTEPHDRCRSPTAN
jgi:hypothetical protein